MVVCWLGVGDWCLRISIGSEIVCAHRVRFSPDGQATMGQRGAQKVIWNPDGQETGISISRSCYHYCIEHIHYCTGSALSKGSLLHRATHHGTGKDRPYVHDSGRGREAVCVSMRSGKGDKRFFCIRDLVRGFWGNAIVIGAQVPGWWRLAAVKARRLGLTHTEGSRYLKFAVTAVLHPRAAVSLARSLHRLEVFAWHVFLMQIPLIMVLPVARINAVGDLVMICG